MKKSRDEMTCLNGAAFRIGAEAVRGSGLEALLDETLAEVVGGDGLNTSCTEFTCNVYAPPPPPVG
ncbi:MAG TPA: hypothetical protein VF173_02515 [Thermoanaerobaculia bacterium]|nr:hypothetical protein [Thermoanaerobaculia bacterium]